MSELVGGWVGGWVSQSVGLFFIDILIILFSLCTTCVKQTSTSLVSPTPPFQIYMCCFYAIVQN